MSVEFVSASELFDIEGGTQPPKSTFVYEPTPGYIRLVQIRDFEGDGHETYIRNSSKWRRCAESDTLIARYGASVGRICRGLSGAYNVALTKVVPRPGVDRNFLHYLLTSRFFQGPLLAASGRSAQAGFNKDDLRVIRLPKLPTPEQIKVGELFKSLDDKVERNRRMNETLERMAQAIFRDWFVDFGPVRRKLEGATDPVKIMGGVTQDADEAARLAALFPAALADNGLPKAWGEVPLSDLVELNPAEPLKKGAVAPYTDMAALPTSGSLAAPPILREFGSGMRFRNGDALIARVTPCLENGKAVYVDFLPENAPVGWGSTEFIVLRSRPPVPATFAYLMVRHPEFRERAIQSMTGTSGRQRAQSETLANFQIARADAAVYEAFGGIIHPMFALITANGAQNQTLAVMRDLLLPKLMSGEIRLKDAEKIAEAAE